MAAGSSAGIVLYRRRDHRLEVLLGHMGGPFWSRKDDGAWTIPKGEYAVDRDDGSDDGSGAVDADAVALAAARREFAEEIGVEAPEGPYVDLGTVAQSRKVVRAWAVEGDVDPAAAVSNTFEIEWPPRSGRTATFPELDRVEWFDVATARTKVVRAQAELLDRLAETARVSPARSRDRRRR